MYSDNNLAMQRRKLAQHVSRQNLPLFGSGRSSFDAPSAGLPALTFNPWQSMLSGRQESFELPAGQQAPPGMLPPPNQGENGNRTFFGSPGDPADDGEANANANGGVAHGHQDMGDAASPMGGGYGSSNLPPGYTAWLQSLLGMTGNSGFGLTK